MKAMYWDFGSSRERLATQEERELVTQLLTSELEKDEGKLQYEHVVRNRSQPHNALLKQECKHEVFVAVAAG